MKFRSLATLFSAVSVLVLAACATTPGQPGGPDVADVPAAAETERTYTVTGSRIQRRGTPDEQRIPHTSSPVVIFTREDVDATGHRDLDQALIMLHPAFR